MSSKTYQHRDLDLRNAHGCGRNVDEVEVAEELTSSHLPW